MCKPLGAVSIETSTTYGTTPAQVAGQLFAMCQKSSTFALAFERRDEGVFWGPGPLPKIRDFRGLHKGKAMRSDEDSLRRLVRDNDNVNDNDNKLPTPKLFDS